MFSENYVILTFNVIVHLKVPLNEDFKRFSGRSKNIVGEPQVGFSDFAN